MGPAVSGAVGEGYTPKHGPAHAVPRLLLPDPHRAGPARRGRRAGLPRGREAHPGLRARRLSGVVREVRRDDLRREPGRAWSSRRTSGRRPRRPPRRSRPTTPTTAGRRSRRSASKTPPPLPGQHPDPAGRSRPQPGASSDAGRRVGCLPRRGGRTRLRLVLAARRVAHRTGRPGGVARPCGLEGRVPARPPRPPRRGHHRISVRHPELRGEAGVRRGRRAPAAPAAARPAGARPDAGLRSQPHGPRPSVGARAS